MIPYRCRHRDRIQRIAIHRMRICIRIRRLIRSGEGEVGDVRRLIVILDRHGGVKDGTKAGTTRSITGINGRRDARETVIALSHRLGQFFFLSSIVFTTSCTSFLPRTTRNIPARRRIRVRSPRTPRPVHRYITHRPPILRTHQRAKRPELIPMYRL